MDTNTTNTTDTTINFSDIFKSSFLDKMSSFTVTDVLIGLFVALAIGLFIYFIYKKTFSGVMYSESFAMSLLAMSVITTVMILAISSNIIISLGMVGALSIVRFRTAIKEPTDIVFLFWAICAGVVVGAGLIPLAVISSIFIGVVLVVFSNKKTRENPYVLVLTLDNEETEKAVIEYVKQNVKRSLLKSKTLMSSNEMELTIEVRLKDQSAVFLNEIQKMPGVHQAMMVSFNGDYMA